MTRVSALQRMPLFDLPDSRLTKVTAIAAPHPPALVINASKLLDAAFPRIGLLSLMYQPEGNALITFNPSLSQELQEKRSVVHLSTIEKHSFIFPVSPPLVATRRQEESVAMMVQEQLQ